jgi:hypothetical protein
MPLELQPEDLMTDEEMQQTLIPDMSLTLHNGGQSTSQNTLQNNAHPANIFDAMLSDLDGRR